MASLNVMDNIDIERALAWLTGGVTDVLYFIQGDLQRIRFEGFFSGIEVIYFASQPYGLRAKFECTSPYGYSNERTVELARNATTNVVVETSDDDYANIRSQIILTPDTGCTTMTITNTTLNNRISTVKFSPAAVSGELVTLDNYLLTISPSAGYTRQRYVGFNKVWFRLMKGKNAIKLAGAGTATLKYIVPKRVGV